MPTTQRHCTVTEGIAVIVGFFRDNLPCLAPAKRIHKVHRVEEDRDIDERSTYCEHGETKEVLRSLNGVAWEPDGHANVVYERNNHHASKSENDEPWNRCISQILALLPVT